jgi:hypothetical protein
MKKKTMTNKKPSLLTVREAVNHAASCGVKVAEDTMYSWYHKFALGIRVGGKVYIKEELLDKVLQGEANGKKTKR